MVKVSFLPLLDSKRPPRNFTFPINIIGVEACLGCHAGLPLPVLCKAEVTQLDPWRLLRGNDGQISVSESVGSWDGTDLPMTDLPMTDLPNDWPKYPSLFTSMAWLNKIGS